MVTRPTETSSKQRVTTSFGVGRARTVGDQVVNQTGHTTDGDVVQPARDYVHHDYRTTKKYYGPPPNPDDQGDDEESSESGSGSGAAAAAGGGGLGVVAVLALLASVFHLNAS